MTITILNGMGSRAHSKHKKNLLHNITLEQENTVAISNTKQIMNE